MENTSSERNTNEEIIEQLVKKVNELDKRKAEIPDYAKEFESLKKWIQEQMPDCSKPIKELEKMVMLNNLDYPTQQIRKQLDEVKAIVRTIPKNIPVKYMHHFGSWSKSFIIGVVVCFVVTAISVGTALHLNHQNDRLNREAFNFWLVRALYPKVAKKIEAKLSQDPNRFIKKAEKAMAKQQAILATEEKD